MPSFVQSLGGGRTGLSAGGGGGGGSAMSLYNNALAANRAELASLVDMARAREAKVMSDLDAYGRTQLTDLADSHRQNMANVQQNAISRGLSNSTIRQSMELGANVQNQRAMDRINNDIALRRAETYGRLSGDTLNILSRGMTPYPSYGEYASADRADRALQQQYDLATMPRTQTTFGGGGGGGSGGGGGGRGGASQGGSFADWARGTYFAGPTNAYNYNAYSGGGYGVAPARGGWPGGLGLANPNAPTQNSGDGGIDPNDASTWWPDDGGGFGPDDVGGLGGYGEYT